MPNDSKPPYFEFYPRDFLADDAVMAMSTEAVGAYILLLCVSWHAEDPGFLPADDRRLAAWSRLSMDRWPAVRTELLTVFEETADGRWLQRRLRAEYEKFRRRAKAAVEAGRIGALKRWHSHPIGSPQRNDGYSASDSTEKQKQQRPPRNRAREPAKPLGELLPQAKLATATAETGAGVSQSDAGPSFDAFCQAWPRWPEQSLKKNQEKSNCYQFWQGIDVGRRRQVMAQVEKYSASMRPGFKGAYPFGWITETFGHWFGVTARAVPA